MLLQNKNINRAVYVKPPKEPYCHDTLLWKLKTTICRLNDASRSWYLNVKKELIEFDAIVCKSVFVWHNQSIANGLLCTQLIISSLGELTSFYVKLFTTLNVSSKLDKKTVPHISMQVYNR